MNFSEHYKQNYTDLFLLDYDKALEEIIDILHYCIISKRQIILIGNGGSALSASHFVQDLTKVCGANAKCLTDNMGLVLALSNDLSYDEIFRWQLERLSSKDCVLVAISCSGNSVNIMKAAEFASRTDEMMVFSFTGNEGGLLKSMSDVNINVPTSDIYVSESVHSVFLHFIIEELERRLNE